MADLVLADAPNRPGGGYAKLDPAAGKVFKDDPVFVTIYNGFREKYLTNAGHWHGAADQFGPYAVEADGSVVLGPEIVNHIEEYALVRIRAGGLTADISWPDTVFAAPGAPEIGRVYSEDQAPSGILSGNKPTEEDTIEEQTIPVEDVESEIPQVKRSIVPMICAILALCAVGAGIGWYLYTADGDDTAEDPPVVDACSVDGLRGVDGGYSGLLSAALGCGSNLRTEDAFVAFENLVRASDPNALLAFGHLYNGQVTDPQLETQMGITLSDNPAVAADYYSRAVGAGNTDAADVLVSVCMRLTQSDNELWLSAATQHCPDQ